VNERTRKVPYWEKNCFGSLPIIDLIHFFVSNTRIQLTRKVIEKVFGKDTDIKPGSCQMDFEHIEEVDFYPLHEKPKESKGPIKRYNYHMVAGLVLGFELLDKEPDRPLIETLCELLYDKGKGTEMYLDDPSLCFLSCYTTNKGYDKKDRSTLILTNVVHTYAISEEQLAEIKKKIEALKPTFIIKEG